MQEIKLWTLWGRNAVCTTSLQSRVLSYPRVGEGRDDQRTGLVVTAQSNRNMLLTI